MDVHRLRPDQPFDADYPLSLVDGVMPRINSRYLFVYDTRKTPESQLAFARADLLRRLKDGLQCMLRQPEEGVLALPELMGKIYENPIDGKLNLKITKSSWVNLVVAYREDITLESLKPEQNYPRQGFNPDIFCAGTDPVAFPTATEGCPAFAPQITFIRGGYIIMVNKHHSLLDATSSSRLVKWWFANTHNISSHTHPPISASDCLAIHDRTPLLPTPSKPTHDHSTTWKLTPGAAPTIFGLTLPPKWVLTILKNLPFKLLPEASSHIFYFSTSSLDRLKKSTEAHTTSRFSTNDALVALVWTSIMRARKSHSASKPSATDASCNTTSVSMSVNMRSRLSPPLPESYFGNAVSVISTSLPLSTLLPSSNTTPAHLASTTLSIRQSLSTRTTNDFCRSYISLISSQPKISDCKMILNLPGNDVYMNSWETLYSSMDELDLGFGEFQRVRLPMANPFPGFANVLPAYGCRDRDCLRGDGEGEKVRYKGGLEVMLDLSGEDMRRLKADGEFMQYVDSVY